ncbi:unnamed protein product [Mycena citricolor]|uniref:2,3-bisphosphoglycerate-independent phosphoglycerate mutase n=1 Tax=Mycena citricolor TaxID=2018698 RepID=A0AAD2HVK0_9AGAR|nr:unnamed protein product [Mycena citricolor]
MDPTVGIVSIHRARGPVTKDVLNSGMEQLVDALVVDPFVQQRWNKVELVVQTPDLIEHFENLGLDPPLPIAILLVECRSVDEYVQARRFSYKCRPVRHSRGALIAQVLTHSSLDPIFSQAETQFGFKSNGSAFSADVAIRLHRPASEDGKPHSTAMALMKVPQDLHPQEHHDALGPRFEEWVTMPQQEEYLRKHAVWSPNDDLDARLGEIGFPSREHLLIVEIQGEIIEHPSFDDAFQGHTEWGNLWGGAFKQSECFSYDIQAGLDALFHTKKRISRIHYKRILISTQASNHRLRTCITLRKSRRRLNIGRTAQTFVCICVRISTAISRYRLDHTHLFRLPSRLLAHHYPTRQLNLIQPNEMPDVKEKVCLIVHDGWGVATVPGLDGNAIEAGTTTNMDTIGKENSLRLLAAHGTAVGLNDGLMGNSEVGHLNIGAGRIVYQDIVKIDVSIKKRQFHKNATILESFKHAKDGNGRLHLIGLLSDGGVHSHNSHLYALLETAKEQGVPSTYIHCIGDGRDTAPRSAPGYVEALAEVTKKLEYGEIATYVGRYYAMDRDKRWERVKIAVDGLVGGVGEEGTDLVKAIKSNYEKDVTDEFMKPIIVNGEAGRIKDGDTIFFFNYRSDRMREIASVFGLPDKPMEVTIPKDLHITTMSRYNSEFPFPVAFPPQAMTNVLAEWLGKQGTKQAHIAETEKYAHVTFFFNGGVEAQYENEERHMVASPKVATYDLKPEMSVQDVADKVAEVVESNVHDFVMCNFAPPDMVGHTGVYDAAVKAITATDAAVGTVFAACQRAGYTLLVTADHGNAEQMKNLETGAPHTAHTCNPVPFILAAPAERKTKYALQGDEEGSDEEPGALCDVAPTILDLMGLPQPEDMTGRSLLVRN